ncbi:heavy metal-associated isoprenylated plant protein 28-like [Iris pallida]|uniref:Heavy metal-associated isoprenylated plant protein 28-like n=1 Tax=Iris pallida TaxID=29817 RepID=A0AAX6DPU0_IRIPA|nr:heavy metal-associated isoprenylated plant protein 28-like [Iris pallida]
MTIVEMSVHMDCEGCEKKIRKALLKLKGVDNVDIDIARQKVIVTGWTDQNKILKAVRATGRTAVLWPYPYNVEYDGNYDQQHYHRHHHPSHDQQHHGFYYGAHPYVYASTSSYNYRKHGYDDSHMQGYYQRPAYSTVDDNNMGHLFSDENTNACSIM